MPQSASAQPERDSVRRARKIARVLAQVYADAACALTHSNAFELLAATILSAQCTDARVNLVTPHLFRRYPDAAALAGSTQEDVEEMIRSTGFFRAKATSLRGMARKLTDDFGGVVPKTMEEMLTLPGVGRKTANVVLGTAYGLATGVVVDTHVSRITRLLGLTDAKTPEQIERDMQQLLPKTGWVDFSHRLIWHGRKVCIARRPRCIECPLLSLCDRVGLPALPVTGRHEKNVN